MSNSHEIPKRRGDQEHIHKKKRNKITLEHIKVPRIKPVQMSPALGPWHGPQALAKGLGTYPPNLTVPRYEVMWMRALSTPCRLQSQHRGSYLLLSVLFPRQHGVAHGTDWCRQVQGAFVWCWPCMRQPPSREISDSVLKEPGLGSPQIKDVDSTRCPVSRKHLWESLPLVLWQVEHFITGIHGSCEKKKTLLLENQHVM